MKAILLFTVLLCSNALASPVDFPKPHLTSNEPVHIIDIDEPVHIIDINEPVHIIHINEPVHIIDINEPVHIIHINEPVHIIDINEPVHIIHINDLPEKILPSPPFRVAQMKAHLLFTVLRYSNALASPVDFPKPRLTSNEPMHINDLPADILNQSILARVDWPSRKNFKLTDKQNSKTVDLTKFFDEFLLICQANRYLACRKYALYLLTESTGKFARKNLLEEALQRAVKEGNGWAVSALSDVVEFSQNFYFGILENYLNERKSNQDLITLDVLRRKSIKMDPDRAWWLAHDYGYLDYITTYPRPRMGECILLDESSVAAIKDAIKISDHEQVYTLIQAFHPYGLRKAGILSYACQYGDQFAVFYATKDFLMRRKQSSGLNDADELTIRKSEEQSSSLNDAYEQARIVGKEDAVEFFQQFYGIHGKKKIGRWEQFKHFSTTWTWERLGGLARWTPFPFVHPPSN